MEPSIRRNEVVANISTLVDRARRQYAGRVGHARRRRARTRSVAWPVPEPVADTEPVVHKTYGDAFEATELDVLAGLDVGSLVVAGA